MNNIRLPIRADFNTPEKYGLSLNEAINFKIHTPDNETLGAWFIFASSYLKSTPNPNNQHIPLALTHYPTVLFFHGNAATRAFHARILYYKAFSSQLGVNILAIDYRGFADSTGIPTEAGLVCDARAAWDWLIGQGASEKDILVVGHSLGTGVASQLSAQLSDDGIECNGVVLLSPFSSVTEALKTYNIFGVIPVMKPLSMIPPLPAMITQALVHKFDSLKIVPRIKHAVLIAHAEDDWVIPHTHSDVLFNAFLQPLLPESDDDQNDRRQEIVSHNKYTDNEGVISQFTLNGRKVVLVKTSAGGHDYIGLQKTVKDAIGRSFGFC